VTLDGIRRRSMGPSSAAPLTKHPWHARSTAGWDVMGYPGPQSGDFGMQVYACLSLGASIFYCIKAFASLDPASGTRTMAEIVVEPCKLLTPEIFAAISSLIKALSTTARAPTWGEIDEVVTSPATTLFLARDGTQIVGMLTLILVRIPTGLRGHIEDVVVAESHRKKGIGEALTRHAIAVTKISGTRTLDLTSRPSREAANRLYQRLGFKLRDTLVYRYTL
jgi:ribosomal protein S18 acetylase RimI-like enzyme